MNEHQISEIWTLFKEYFDKKHVEIAAERFIDFLADYGISDVTLKECLGTDADLDAAIYYYLDIDEDIEEDEWED